MAVLLLNIYKTEPFYSFSLRFNDITAKLQNKDVSKEVVFVAVDEQSVNEFGRWPWDRAILAKGIDNLSQASVVLMDMIFSETTANDVILANSLQNLNTSVCGFFLREKSTQAISETQNELLGDSSLDILQNQIAQEKTPIFAGTSYAELNTLDIMNSCSLNGSFSTLSESDQLFRGYPIALYYANTLYPSLGVQGLRAIFESDVKRIDDKTVELGKKQIHLDEKGFVRLNFYKPSQYKTISFLAVATNKIPPQEFKNKIVILGITEVGAGDVASTPIGRIAGPLLHYTFISNYLQDHLIEELPTATRALIVFSALIPFALLLLFKNITRRIAAGVAVYALLFGLVSYLFISSSLYIDAFYPLLALIGAFIAVESLAFSEQEKQEKFLKGAFSSYLSAELLEKLIKNPSALTLGGESKELTILFSDIRGFTTISESMPPPALIKLLNRYFTPMTETVLVNGGMLDKYIGDAVMAFFNAPVDIKYHADAACKSALEMLERLHLLNQTLKLEGITPISIGIGINSAEVVVGNMGSDNRFNYTVIGDGVNLASRVESLTKYYGATIIITEFTVASLHDYFVYRELERVKVKGKDDGVLLYELLQSGATEQKKIYDEALLCYKNSDTQNAKKLFEALFQEYDDGVARYFLNLIKNEIPWQERVMSEK